MKTAIGLIILLLPPFVAADTVVPVDEVSTYVKIRKAPDAGADVVSRLHKSKPRPLVNTVPGWHEVELDDGSTGFVSADWSSVVKDQGSDGEPAAVAESRPEPEPVEPEAAPDEPEPVVSAPEPEPETEPEPEPEISEPEPPVAPTPAAASLQQDPPGPRGEGRIKGEENFLVKFRKPTVGGNSQIWDDGNFVGIGTTEPKQRLEVNGSIQIHEQNSSVAGLMITQSSGDTGYILHNRASTLTIGAGSIDRITIDREGHIGFGTDRPGHPIEMASGAYVSAGGVWTNASSRSLKENVASLNVEDALAALAELEPVQFNYRNDHSESYVGFIAEDVPSLVATNDRQSLSTMDIVAVLTKVVQAQQAKIEELEARIDSRNR